MTFWLLIAWVAGWTAGFLAIEFWNNWQAYREGKRHDDFRR